jgi:hypothetical protein
MSAALPAMTLVAKALEHFGEHQVTDEHGP